MGGKQSGVSLNPGGTVNLVFDPTVVNKTGDTKLRLRLVDGGGPVTGANIVNFASFENITYAEPKLRYDDLDRSVTEKITVEFGNEPANDVPAASFECKLDFGAWAPCTSPKTYTGLTFGAEHTFKVRALNAQGVPELDAASQDVWTSETDEYTEVAYSPVKAFFAPVLALFDIGVLAEGAHSHSGGMASVHTEREDGTHLGPGMVEGSPITESRGNFQGPDHYKSFLINKHANVCNDCKLGAQKGWDPSRGDGKACAYNRAPFGKACKVDGQLTDNHNSVVWRSVPFNAEEHTLKTPWNWKKNRQGH